MHSLDGSQVRCAQRRSTVQGYLRGGHAEDTAKDTANTRGDTEEGPPGRGVGAAIRAAWASPGALQAG